MSAEDLRCVVCNRPFQPWYQPPGYCVMPLDETGDPAGDEVHVCTLRCMKKLTLVKVPMSDEAKAWQREKA